MGRSDINNIVSQEMPKLFAMAGSEYLRSVLVFLFHSWVLDISKSAGVET